MRVATVYSSSGGHSTVKYFHVDYLGSTRLITSFSASVLFADSHQPLGHDNGTPTGSETYKFTGKPFSSSTGLYYYGARWYDANIGRFISPDPRPGRLSRPQTLNPYTYVVNSPLNYVDPWGEAECGFWDVGCHAGNVWNAGVNAWNGLSPEQQQLITLAVFVAITFATGGTDLLVVGAIGFALGAGIYAGATLATGGTPTLHGILQWGTIGFMAATAVASLPSIGPRIMGGLGLRGAEVAGEAAADATPIARLLGRLGGPLHRGKVAEIVTDIESRGLVAKAEYYVRGVRRFADVAAFVKGSRVPVEVYQVGRLTLRGLPVAREWGAIADLEDTLELIVRFIPYNV